MVNTGARGPDHSRRRGAAALAVVALLAGLLTSAAGGPVSRTPYFGILAAPASMTSAALHQNGVRRVSVNLGWNLYQPTGSGAADSTYVAAVRGQLAGYRAAGFDVVLDLGLQYPPAWVFTLPGQTRFVDQDGAVWHGRSSEDVPNAVFNPAVRAAQASYVRTVAADLGAQSFAAVRLGGLLSGELRYPPASTAAGTGSSLWAYDPRPRRVHPSRAGVRAPAPRPTRRRSSATTWAHSPPTSRSSSTRSGRPSPRPSCR